jgi:aminoglycoside phosphotransferase (APT) family kinase protein
MWLGKPLGWGNCWTAAAAAELRSQALTMKHIQHKCKIPIPEVLAFDTSFNNGIHAPFILMTYVEGKSVWNAW